MANRFTQISPIRFDTPQFIPEPVVPDFNRIFGVLDMKSKELEALKQAGSKIPEHAPQDTEDVMKYVEGVQSEIDSIASAYATGDYSGISGLRDKFIQSRTRDFQPGGEAYAYTANAKSRQAYVEQIDKALEKGTINSDRANKLKAYSDNLFGKTDFNADTREFNRFGGLDPAKQVSIDDIALDRAKGWKASKISEGFKLMPNGEFYSEKTKEYVSAKEVYDNIASSLVNDEAVVADLRQYAKLNGLDFQKVLNFEIDRAAKLAAAKEGFVSEEMRNVRQNNALKQRRAKELIDYQMKQEQVNSSIMFSGNPKAIAHPFGGNIGTTLGAVRNEKAMASNALRTFNTQHRYKSPELYEKLSDWAEQMKIDTDDYQDPELWLRAYEAGVFSDVMDNNGQSYADNAQFRSTIRSMRSHLLKSRAAENRIRTAWKKENPNKPSNGPAFQEFYERLNGAGSQVDELIASMPETESLFNRTQNQVADTILEGGSIHATALNTGRGQMPTGEYWVTLQDKNGKTVKSVKIKDRETVRGLLATSRELKESYKDVQAEMDKVSTHMSEKIIVNPTQSTELMLADGETKKHLESEFKEVLSNAGAMNEIISRSDVSGPANAIIADGKYNTSNVTATFIPELGQWYHSATISDGEKSAVVNIPQNVLTTKGLQAYASSSEGQAVELLSNVQALDPGQSVQIPGMIGVEIYKSDEGVNSYTIEAPFGIQSGSISELKEIIVDMLDVQDMKAIGLSDEQVMTVDQLQSEYHIEPGKNQGDVSGFHRALRERAGLKEHQIHSLFPRMIQKPR